MCFFIAEIKSWARNWVSLARDVEPEPWPSRLTILAEPSDQAKYDPADDGHACASLVIITQGVALYTPAANSTVALRFEHQMIHRSCVHLRSTD